MTHKKQHFVPKAYLSAWTDPDTPSGQEPYVWIFPKSGGGGRRRAPANVFTESDFYTVHTSDGGRNLSFEHGLAQLETGIIRLRKDFLEVGKQLPFVPRLKLAAFVAAMHSRTPRFRDHHRQQWQKVLDMGSEIMEAMKTKTPEEKQRASDLNILSSGTKSMSMEDVEKIVNYPIQMIAPAAIEAEIPFLVQMRLLVLSAPPGQGFLTSDAPVVWYDPEGHKRPPMWREPALMHDSLEITMPMSPRQLLMIVHEKPMSRGVKPIKYIDISSALVAELNRRTLAFAEKEVIAEQNAFDPRWLSETPVG